jgi:very-short-patch-repair endonuclease
MANHSSRSSSFESQLSARAHLHGRNLTHSESALWQYLSGSQLGVAFKRQVPLDRYIVDFLAPSIGLIVEVDGEWHQRRVTADERRDSKLTRMGYRVLRLDAALVMREPLVAVARVREAIAAEV